MTPDIHTLLLILTLASLLQTAALVIQKVLIKTYKGLNWWMWGYLAITTNSFILLLLQTSNSLQPFPEFIANLLFVMGLASLYIGTLRFLDKKENRVTVISVAAAFILVYLYFAYITYNYLILTATDSIPLAIFAFCAAWQLFTHKPRYISASANLVCGIFTFFGIFFACVSVAVFYTDPITSLFDPTALQILTFLVPFVASISLTFGLIIMVNQRLNTEMQQANDKLDAAYAEEKKLCEQLEDEAKNRIRFIDELAHELKGPLTPILASAGILQEILKDNSESTQKRLADNVYEGTNKLIKRLEELLDVARFARGSIGLDLKPTDTSKFIKM